jgi:hypothetical protein
VAETKERLQPCGIGKNSEGVYTLVASDGKSVIDLGKNAECQTLEGALKFWQNKLAVLNQDVERYERSTAMSFVGVVREDIRPARDSAAKIVEALKKCMQRQLGTTIK